VSMECRRVLYSRILVGVVNEESRVRRWNILRNVPVALWQMVCRCLVKRSLESNRGPRYFTVREWYFGIEVEEGPGANAW
jgi:hypothetical protein